MVWSGWLDRVGTPTRSVGTRARLVTFFALVIVGILFADGVHAASRDASCYKNGANCDDDEQGRNEHYWVKIKRLSDFDMGEFGTTDALVKRRFSTRSQPFCAIAFCEGKRCKESNPDPDKRQIYDYQISVTGLNPKSSNFVLTASDNSDDSVIPVKLELHGEPGSAQDGKSWNISQTIDIPESQNHAFCRDNNFVIAAEVSPHEVLSNATTTEYEGEFELTVFSIMPHGKQLTASVEFNITLTIIPGIQISGLEDMTLVNSTGNIAKDTQKFCVFAFGVNQFSIKATSNKGNADHFALLHGTDHTITYSMEISDLKDHTRSYSKNDEAAKKGFSPTNDLFCRNENMTLTIETDKISGPAGVYSDTMTLIVAPEQ